MLLLGTLPQVLHHPETSEASAVGTMAGVSSHLLLHSPSQPPDFKLSYCDWRLKADVLCGDEQLTSSLLVVVVIAFCQRLHLCVWHFAWCCQKSTGLRISFAGFLFWHYHEWFGLCELLHFSWLSLPRLMINLGQISVTPLWVYIRIIWHAQNIDAQVIPPTPTKSDSLEEQEPWYWYSC